jgi:hypothetical protein
MHIGHGVAFLNVSVEGPVHCLERAGSSSSGSPPFFSVSMFEHASLLVEYSIMLAMLGIQLCKVSKAALVLEKLSTATA